MAGHVLGLAALCAVAVAGALVATALLWHERRRRLALETSLQQASTQLDAMVVRDGLTGLLSRTEFDLALDDAVQRADGGGARFALLYVDLDNLRSVNDLYGHEAGDAVLRQAAARMAACFNGRQVVASRMAADEFTLIVPGDCAAGVAAAQRVIDALAQPFPVNNGRDAPLSCSIGVAAYPQHGARQRLVGNAMLAMRSVKSAGGSAFAEYDPRMGIAQREEAELLQDLRGATQRGQFELYYQPKIDAASLQVTAAEALLRWHHPRRGLISPDVFIPLAERHGLIGTIGDWVITEACRQAGAWRERGLRMRVAVNISGYQLRQEDLVSRIEAALVINRIAPSRFTCEITESVAMEDTQVTLQAFDRLRRAGVHVSIDDFGTGHSSLASLRRLPAAELKIDRAFVSDLATSADARSIVQAIVKMAHTLDLHVVAEGVETEAQRDLLVEMGCDELQGYLFAKPMTAQALLLWASDEDAPGSAPGFRASLFAETRPAVLD